MMKTANIVLLSALFVVSGQALAQTEVAGYQCGVEREVSAGALTERTYNRLSDIYEMIGEDNYAEAYPALESLLERNRTDEYASATILQAMAFVRAQQEQYEDAINFFKRAIDLNQLPNSQHYQMILQVAQLYYTIDRFSDALDQLDIWFCVTPDEQENKVDVWVMKASIHAQIDEFREAIAAIERAIALSDEPKEQWYQLKLGMHFELEEYAAAAEVLQILIRMNPEKKSYWVQLASVYVQLDRNRDSMAVLSLAHRKGLLDKQGEYMQLASLQQEFDFPRKAAEVLQEGLEQGIVENTRRNWEMAGGAWYEAKELERALDAYERAGAQSTDGKIDLQRAFILTDQERWEEAVEALSRAVELGGLSDSQTGNAYLLLGTALYNTGDVDGALEAFNEATDYGRVETAAREWMNHIRNERSRRASS
ncbi:tetratricopeptide repeat protein [Wenzhouxiangella sediminis]|uniref:Tetratricopeptide repeat protein n=2 Tax=Wenzhouxiangella sediminis TaxID=1792836 RepID=A0A3E1K9B5_9GAMM|nr:tetratricopeptide repeat protein [Wenzhouxiangella sediminis]